MNDINKITIDNIMRKTKTSSAVKNRYNAKHYASINLKLDKELVQEFKEKIKENNESQADIFRQAIKQYLQDNE